MMQDLFSGLDHPEKALQRHGNRKAEERDLFVMPVGIGDKMIKIKVSQTAFHKDVEKAVAVNLFHVRFLLQFIVEVLGPGRRRNIDLRTSRP